MTRILTVDEAAEMLRLNPQVVREYLRKRKLPGCKIGRHWRVSEDEIERFVREGRWNARTEREVQNARVREWRSLSPEERRRRLDSIAGKFPSSGHAVDDFLREKHAETAEEERRLLRREWRYLDREEKLRRIDSVMGKFADIPFSSEDLMRERREEVEREEQRQQEQHRK
jgi:excisionase family DNA binding protein